MDMNELLRRAAGRAEPPAGGLSVEELHAPLARELARAVRDVEAARPANWNVLRARLAHLEDNAPGCISFRELRELIDFLEATHDGVGMTRYLPALRQAAEWFGLMADPRI